MCIKNLILPLEKPLLFFRCSHLKEILNNIQSVINFYTKALKRFPEKYFRRYWFWIGLDLDFIGQIKFSRNFHNNWHKNVNFRQIFKIILRNDVSLQQMYSIELNFSRFLTYWFLKIKWLLAKSVKITKEVAIHKNEFLQSL